MKQSNKLAIRFTALAAMITLAGCLSSGKGSGLANSPGNPPAPPSPPSNGAPTISGTPSSSVLVDDQYSFTPNASDPDNDPLTFSVGGEPDWLNIDSGSGELSGTPTLEHVGTYPGIVVSVSDGSLSSSLPQFTVDVVQNASGSVTLSWTAPTLNEDGTTLTNLDGYIIYYGTSTRNYTTEILVENESITTFVVDNLASGTYYFAAKAFNLAGERSNFSGEAVRSVP